MNLKKILTDVGILGLFIFGMLAFMVMTQTENSVSTPLTDNPAINATYSQLYSNLTSAGDSAESASQNFGNTTPTQQFGELEVNSIVSPTKVGRTIIVGFWNIFIALPQIILGVDAGVASLISSLLLILMIIGIWAIWKGVVD